MQFKYFLKMYVGKHFKMKTSNNIYCFELQFYSEIGPEKGLRNVCLEKNNYVEILCYLREL